MSESEPGRRDDIRDVIAQAIRVADGNNTMGAGALADAIWLDLYAHALERGATHLDLATGELVRADQVGWGWPADEWLWDYRSVGWWASDRPYWGDERDTPVIALRPVENNDE